MTKEKKLRKWALTPAETNNVAFRQTVMEYIGSAINTETGRYIGEIRQRLGVEPEIMLKLSKDNKWLEEEKV